MPPLPAGRFLLREFEAADRDAFVGYQRDPRYRALYDLPAEDAAAAALFDRFLQWQHQQPRRDLQLAIIDPADGSLLGTAGLRQLPGVAGWAELGIELAPAQWGRHRLALDVVQALLAHGFAVLRLDGILGETASGNRRVAKLAGRFGASLQPGGETPGWMAARGWQGVRWVLRRESWEAQRS